MARGYSETRTNLRFPASLLNRLDHQPDGCIRWTGKPYKSGYGYIYMDGKKCRVHVAAWRYFVGPIPEGLVLDHLCCDPRWCAGGVTCPHRTCVRLDHLQPKTPTENTLRGNGVGAVNARKTHCIHGHEFTEENTYVYTDNAGKVRRTCRVCRRATSRRFRASVTAA